MSFIAEPLVNTAKAIAAGRAQADLGLQSAHTPDAIVRVGRFLYVFSLGWIAVSWYTGYVNQRTTPGGGPTLVLPGTKAKLTDSPDRPDPTAPGYLAGGGPASGGGNAGAPAFTGGNASGHGIFGAAHVTWERTDQGVDVSMAPGTPIFSLMAGKVTAIQQNWYAGQPLVCISSPGLPKVLGKQATGIYYAEQIAPVVRVGDSITAGQRIGTYAKSGTGMEIGFAADAAGTTLARVTGGYKEGQATPAGQVFRQFMASHGVKGL